MKVPFYSKGGKDERINLHLFGCAKDTLIYVAVGCGAIVCNGTLGKSFLGKVKFDIIQGCEIKTQVRRRYRRHFHKSHPKSVVSEFFLKYYVEENSKRVQVVKYSGESLDLIKQGIIILGRTFPKSHWPGSL